MGKFLTQIQRANLVDVLDRIIPRTGEMPGAGQIAVEYVEAAALESAVTARVEIADTEKVALLEVVAEQRPSLFGEFVGLVYDGYYTDASVIERLGPDAGKPQPEGRPIAPFDPQIVVSVRQLGPRYRTI